jgi:hypothetical protein
VKFFDFFFRNFISNVIVAQNLTILLTSFFFKKTLFVTLIILWRGSFCELFFFFDYAIRKIRERVIHLRLKGGFKGGHAGVLGYGGIVVHHMGGLLE